MSLWYRASLVAQRLKRLPALQETWVRSLGWEDPLEKEMATHSSIPAWRIPWREEPGRLQSMRSQRIGHDWATSFFHFDTQFIKNFLNFIYFWWNKWNQVGKLKLFLLFSPPWPHGLQHARLPCPSLFPGVCSISYPLSQHCHPTILSFITPFSSCPQSFPASGTFLMSQFFTSGGQSTGVSASASVLPMNIQGWFPLGLTGLIPSLSQGLSRVFCSTIIWKHACMLHR